MEEQTDAQTTWVIVAKRVELTLEELAFVQRHRTFYVPGQDAHNGTCLTVSRLKDAKVPLTRGANPNAAVEEGMRVICIGCYDGYKLISTRYNPPISFADYPTVEEWRASDHYQQEVLGEAVTTMVGGGEA